MKRTHRWFPLWGGILLAIPVIGCTGGMLGSVKGGTSSALQLPIFGLFIYAWLVMLCNRTDTTVDGEGATIRNGPIWCGALPLLRIERRSVKCLLFRCGRGEKYVTHYFSTAEVHDGRLLDLCGPYPKPELARRDSLEIARIWARPDSPVDTTATFTYASFNRRRAALITLGWGGAFIAALLWAAYVEIYLR